MLKNTLFTIKNIFDFFFFWQARKTSPHTAAFDSISGQIFVTFILKNNLLDLFNEVIFSIINEFAPEFLEEEMGRKG